MKSVYENGCDVLDKFSQKICLKREKRGGHFGESRPSAFHILEANLNKLCPNRDRGTSQKIHIFAFYEREKIEKM